MGSNSELNLELLRSYTHWVAPTFEDFKIEMATEEGSNHYAQSHVGELFKSGHIVTLTPEQIDNMQRGAGDNPPIEWLLNKYAANRDGFEGGLDEYRYGDIDHETGKILDRFKTSQALTMPIVIESNSRYTALGGRHRIAYARVLGISLQVFVVDAHYLDEPTKQK